MRTKLFLTLALGVLVGIVVGYFLAAKTGHAQIAPTWDKSEVTPIIMVKPDIGGFSPVTGSSIGNIWRKDEVTPMCLVKPDIGGFTPLHGNSIGNTWPKDEVRPFVSVKAYLGQFIPSGPPVF